MYKKFLVVGLFMMFVASSVLPLSLVAADDEVQATDETVQTLSSPEPTTQDRSSGRDARMKAYQEKKKEKLTDTEKKRTQAKCVSAQEKIASLRTRVNQGILKRSEAYAKVSEKVDVIVLQLQQAGVDTTELETAREDLQADRAVLEESMNSYDAVLADLSEMDCSSDPEAFKGALEAAREYQKTLRQQAQDFRKFAMTEIKALLEKLQSELSA